MKRFEVIAMLISFIGMLFSVDAYPYQPRFDQMKRNVDCHTFPQPISFHVHVTYMLTNDQQISDVQQFRKIAQEHFTPLFNGQDPVCQGTDVEPSGRYGKKYLFSY